MISSIFGKTKPINYVIVLGFVFVFYCLIFFLRSEQSYSLNELALQLIVLGALLFSFFIVNFIARRNQITESNTFAIYFYTLFIVLFPETITDNNAVMCSFFLLLSQRRLISLRSLKNIKLKILDATLWVGVASLFYDWAILFMILIFVGIYFYDPKNYKNWFVPLIGLSGLGIITLAFLMLTNNIGFLERHYRFSIDIDTTVYTWSTSGRLIGYIICTFLAGLFAFLRLGKAGLGRIITMRLIAIALVLALLLTILKSSSGVFPVIVTFFPGAILFTKYTEVIKKAKLKELVLIISLLIPFIVLAADLIRK